MRKRLALTLLLLVSGCMPFRYYPLPASAEEARSTFAPIATAASNLGYRAHQWPDRVVVEPDGHTRIDYMFDASGNYAMCVMLKDKPAEAQRDAAFAAGKRMGDELWTRAMALRMPVAAAPVVAAPPPAPPAPGVQINIGR